jgi:hypothetical protein
MTTSPVTTPTLDALLYDAGRLIDAYPLASLVIALLVGIALFRGLVYAYNDGELRRRIEALEHRTKH